MKQFENRIVLVTGGSRNTGLEIVDRFLREGAKVFFCGTTAESVEKFLSVLNVNILGGFRVVQAACNRFFMKQDRDEFTDQRGAVVFVGSNSSERVSRKRLAYVTSKGGMDTMVKALGVDLGPLGIRVNMVAPGYIWSDRWNWLTDAIKDRRHRNVPTGHEATGQDVAAAVLFLASPGARGFQGARLLMDGGSCAQLYPVDCEDDTSTMRER